MLLLSFEEIEYSFMFLLGAPALSPQFPQKRTKNVLTKSFHKSLTNNGNILPDPSFKKL